MNGEVIEYGREVGLGFLSSLELGEEEIPSSSFVEIAEFDREEVESNKSRFRTHEVSRKPSEEVKGMFADLYGEGILR